MALQTSPPISMQDIANEFGLSLPKSLQELAVAAGVSGPPYSLLDFLGLSSILEGTLIQQIAGTATSESLGKVVRVSGDGSTIIATRPNNPDVVVYVRSGNTWNQQAVLSVAGFNGGIQEFGERLDISEDGNVVIIGVHADDIVASNEGSCYIFVRSGTTWTQQAKLTASDKAGSDNFGIGVSLTDNGNYALVGASGDDPRGSSSGSVYGFVRSGTTWTEVTKIFPSDGIAEDKFGASISISKDGKYAAIGAPSNSSGSGSVFIYVRSGNTFIRQAKLKAGGGAVDDFFGTSVGINADGTTVIIGASRYDGTAGSNEGSAYVFVRSGTTWTQQAQLFPDIKQPSSFYGFDVSITYDGNVALVSHHFSDSLGVTDAGVAFIYQRSGTTWNQLYKLSHSDPTTFDQFGLSLRMSGDGSVAVIGAPGEDTAASGGGSVFIYI